MQTLYTTRIKAFSLLAGATATFLWAALPGLAQDTAPAPDLSAPPTVQSPAAPPAQVPAPSFAPASAPVQSSNSTEPIERVVNPVSRMEIVEKFSKVLVTDAKIKRVDGFAPDVVGITPLAPNQIRVLALAAGVTTLNIVDEFDKIFTIEILVGGDVRALQAELDRHFPGDAVKAYAVRDGILLRSWVQQPDHIMRIVEIAERYTVNVMNQMEVGGPQLVTLKVKVMEVQRAKIRRLGVNFSYFNDDGYLTQTIGPIVPLAGITAPIGGPISVLSNQARLADTQITGGIVDDNQVFQAFIEALRQESMLKVLAEPTLSLRNGRPGQLLAGGEFPIPVPQGLNTVTIDWREFGVRLEAVPIILGNGRVRLELQPEVSERDFTNAVTFGGTLVPALTTRRVNTEVEMRFGQTYMLAGLIATRRTADVSKVPFFGELPWIGAAFRRERFEEAETELVVLVTPELGGPMACEELPPGGPGLFTDSPTDTELFRDGMIEVPFYGDGCTDCGVEPAGPGCAPAGYEGPVPATEQGTLPSVVPSPSPSGVEETSQHFDPSIERTSYDRQPATTASATGGKSQGGLISPRPGLIKPR